jgi:hypothetical protein
MPESDAAPKLVRVTVFVVTLAIGWEPKFTLFTLRLANEVMPVPWSGSVNTDGKALELICKESLAGPPAAGLNVTETAQMSPAARLAPQEFATTWKTWPETSAIGCSVRSAVPEL